jgi:hypothetical protein
MSQNEENLQIVNTASAVETGYYQIPLKDALELPTKGAEKLWCAYVKRGDDVHVIAITGDGPESEANAKFFAGARTFALSLIEREREAERLLLDALNNQIALPPVLRHRIRDFLGLPYEPVKCA